MPEPAQPVIVDGHSFRVTRRPGAASTYDFAWLSGSYDYGFTVAYSSGELMSPAGIEDAIRSFLAQVDPESGYID